MPGEGLNIYFTITDRSSPTLAQIGAKTKALDKETQMLQQSYATLQKANESSTKRQAELQISLKKARAETQEAKKAFDKLGDSASSDAYEKAKQHQDELRLQLSETNKILRENEKIYKQNIETIRKGALSGSAKSVVETASEDLFSKLSTSGITKVLGDSLAGAMSEGLESALGQPLATAVDSALSGVVNGYALGGLTGAILGGVAGTISGLVTTEAAKDDSLKEYYSHGACSALADRVPAVCGRCDLDCPRCNDRDSSRNYEVLHKSVNTEILTKLQQFLNYS